MANNNHLIDVQTAKAFIAANWPNDPLLKQIVFNLLDKLPTVDSVEVVHGRWIEKPYLLGTTRYCSICGQNYGMPHGVFNYCPNCGAKMDEGNEDG